MKPFVAECWHTWAEVACVLSDYLGDPGKSLNVEDETFVVLGVGSDGSVGSVGSGASGGSGDADDADDVHDGNDRP